MSAKMPQNNIWFIVILLVGVTFQSAQEGKAGEFEFDFSTSLAERYDDNIYLTEDDEEEDFITSLTPGFSISYLTPSTNLTASYNPEFEFYAQNSDENDINHNGTLNLDSKITPRLNLSVTDNLTFTPGQDVDQEELRERRRSYRSYASDRLNNFFNTTLSYQIFHATTIRGGFSHSFENYDESEYQDSEEYSYELGVDHQLTGRDTIFSNYRYRRILYDDNNHGWLGYGEENDADVQSFNIGISHRFPRQLLLTVSGGVDFIDEEHEDNETEWSSRVSLAKDFRHGSLGLSFHREVSPSSGEGGTTVNDTVDLTGRKEFTRHLSGNFTAFFSTEKSVSEDETDNEDWGLILGTGYQISRRLTGDLSGSFIRQNSKGLEEGDTDNYRARANINYVILQNCNAFCSYSYYQQNALDPIEEDIEDNLILVGITVKWF